MDRWNIRVKIEGEDISVSASYNGKAVEMTDKTTAYNVAGVLARVSTLMVSHFNYEFKQEKEPAQGKDACPPSASHEDKDRQTSVQL